MMQGPMEDQEQTAWLNAQEYVARFAARQADPLQFAHSLSIGYRVQATRLERGLSQIDLALASGIASSEIRLLESGLLADEELEDELVEALATVLGVAESEFLSVSPAPQSSNVGNARVLSAAAPLHAAIDWVRGAARLLFTPPAYAYARVSNDRAESPVPRMWLDQTGYATLLSVDGGPAYAGFGLSLLRKLPAESEKILASAQLDAEGRCSITLPSFSGRSLLVRVEPPSDEAI